MKVAKNQFGKHFFVPTLPRGSLQSIGKKSCAVNVSKLICTPLKFPQPQVIIMKPFSMSLSWLHTGSLVCPACEDLCGAEFARQGRKCRVGVLPPKGHRYYSDELVSETEFEVVLKSVPE